MNLLQKLKRPAARQQTRLLPLDGDLERRVIEAIRTVYDPEIAVNVYDLGLIYDISIDPQEQIHISMTLTAPGCPVAGILPGQVADAIRTLDGVKEASVALVWDPPWDRDRISDETKLTLGML